MKKWLIEAEIRCQGIPPRCRKSQNIAKMFKTFEVEAENAPSSIIEADKLIKDYSAQEALRNMSMINKNVSKPQLMVYVFGLNRDVGGFTSKEIPLFDINRMTRIPLNL